MTDGAQAQHLDLRASMVDRPGAALRWLYGRYFEAIRFGDEELARIRAAAARGPIARSR